MPNFALFFQSSPAVGKFTEFKLALKSMPVGEHNFTFHLGKEFFENMESADVHNADLTVNLGVVHKNDAYNLDFFIEGTVTLICDRCLDALEMPIEAAYSITVEYGDDYNDESDDVLIIPHADSYLNVAYMIYDTVALAIPIKHVHPQGQCNRAMSAVLKKHSPAAGSLEQDLIDEIDNLDADDASAGTDAPLDSRWAELEKLKENN